MNLPTATDARRHLTRAIRHRYPLVPLLLAGALIVLLAFVVPLDATDGAAARRGADEFANAGATALASEDLATFRTNSRWGVSLQEERDRAEAERQRAEQGEAAGESESAVAWSPELREIGFLGVAITATERVVLLALADDEIVRLRAGQTLEDGRELLAIAEDALTLRQEDGERQRLALFPPAPEPAPEGEASDAPAAQQAGE